MMGSELIRSSRWSYVIDFTHRSWQRLGLGSTLASLPCWVERWACCARILAQCIFPYQQGSSTTIIFLWSLKKKSTILFSCSWTMLAVTTSALLHSFPQNRSVPPMSRPKERCSHTVCHAATSTSCWDQGTRSGGLMPLKAWVSLAKRTCSL